MDFEIKEGGSNLRDHMVGLHDKWKDCFSEGGSPVHVFDREGDGCEFFYRLVSRQSLSHGKRTQTKPEPFSLNSETFTPGR